MSQEEHFDKAGKVVDRVRLTEQLRQFHIDQDNMKNKGVEYSPRFRRNDDLRITGSGDHRCQSPTNPLNSRVSGKEKRRRVHAWLGAQVETGNDSNCGDARDSKHRTKSVGGHNHPSFTSSHKIDLGAGDLAQTDPYLLHSNSEFVTDYDLPFTTKPNQQHSTQTDIQNGSPPYTSKYGMPSRDYIPLIGEPKLTANNEGSDISGGGNKYCYVYDPIIARAYTKKYSVEPTENTSCKALHRGHLLQDETVVKYLPASKNFTPSPAAGKAGVTPTKDLPFTGCETDYPLPTKYEEYDMRPIKPLDAGLKKSLYGENHADDKEDCPPPKPYPRPYLRRSHTSGVTYPTPKPANKTRSSTSKLPSKVQSNIEDTREDQDKVQQHTSETSNMTGQIRRNPTDALPEIPTDQTLDYAQGSKACNNHVKVSPEIRELPADLKHVQAATKIQAVWKGYKTRKLDPKVVEIRQEVRARRAEQYISVLCHEVQCLKENLDAEKKMRDLQTEAIRYIWSQLRMLQKRRNGDKVDGSGRKKTADRRSRSKSISPRRSVKKTNSKTASPLPTTSSITQKSSQQYSESSALDYDEESDSLNSGDETKTVQKAADASWKESPDEELFRNSADHIDVKKGHPIQQDGVQAAEDTDEGRGTLVTDGEGNPAHSSAEEETVQKKDSSHINKESAKMRATIDTLQEQVIQLQEAMFALTDKMVDQNKVPTDLNASEDDLKLVSDCQDTSVVCPEQKLDEIERLESARLAPEPALSARGDVPKISLKNALVVLRSALCENELWALCEQVGHNIKRKPFKNYLALENAFLRKDGRVEFGDIENGDMDDMYLAPEVLDKSSVGTVKSSVFSLSVVLWSAADWEMSADEAPQLTDELESLLVDMSQDDPKKRADIDEVIQICEDHHAKTRVNSLCVCSSLFAEVENAMILAKSGKANQKKIAQEISQDLEVKTKTMFRESVVPHINSCGWHSKLKPASERVLSPTLPKVQTPHEKLMESLTTSRASLKKSPRPKVFSVRDMFVSDPELVHKLNILPGQRRKNQKAMRLVMRRQSPKDPSSAPKPGVPTPPRALRAGVSEVANASGHSSVILRWHPSKMFDKQGQEANHEKLIGYRIYVNGHPKGMVAGTKSRALLEGLRHSTEYRVHVRAVSAIGESDPSNTVIAHITSSPILSELKPDCNNGDGDQLHSKSDKNKVEKPVLSHRKPPQPKPRLGAVFPNQQIVESKPSQASSDSSATSYAQESSDDVIDRVLRKYGIQQTSTIVPGFASGSTLSPMPLRCTAKPTTGTSTTTSGQSVVGEGNQKLGTRFALKTETPTISGHTEATSKSLELLTQLKTELLS